MSWHDTPAQVIAPVVNPKPSAFPEWDAKSQDDILVEHQRMQTELAKLKATELDFRKYIVDRCFPAKEEGTNTLELGKGFELKAVVKYNYKLAENDTVTAGLDKIAAIGNQGQFIAERLVSWTPNFLITEYRKLQEDAETGSNEAKSIIQIITEFLTISEAAPTLTIKEPKVKK